LPVLIHHIIHAHLLAALIPNDQGYAQKQTCWQCSMQSQVLIHVIHERHQIRIHLREEIPPLLDGQKLVIYAPWEANKMRSIISFIVAAPVLWMISNMVPSRGLGLYGILAILACAHLIEPGPSFFLLKPIASLGA